MQPQLVSLTEGPSIMLDKPIVLLGRHQECDIQIGSRKISRRHCCLAQVSDYLVVRDLGSTNGIRINGVRVVEGSLRTGDELMIGNQRYQLQWTANPDDPAPPAKPAVKKARREQADPAESSDRPIPLSESMGNEGVLAAKAAASPGPEKSSPPSFDAILEKPPRLAENHNPKPPSGEQRAPSKK
jgi:pSer/pThr/pTyr-binding forkhead associated (FHA) protein